MKQAWIIVLLFGLLAACRSGLPSKTVSSPPDLQTSRRIDSRMTRITGEVIAVDAGISITVKTKQKEVILMLNESTRVTEQKEERMISDVTVGDRLTAAAIVEEDDRLVAKAIRLIPP